MQAGEFTEIIKLAREKQELISKFLALTEQQGEAIENHNYEGIFNIINEKQSIIERVNTIDFALKSITFEPDETIRAIHAQTKEIMAKAILLDENNIKQLRKNKSEIFEKLKNARTNKKTHYLYRGKNVAVEGILLDKKK